MKLKYKINKPAFDLLAPELKEFYTERDGAYVLDAEGAVEKDKLDEFRNTNVALMKDLEKFKGVNLENYNAALEAQRKIQEKEWLDKGEVDKVVEGRVQNMRQDYEAKLADVNKRYESAARQLDVLIIDNATRDAAIKLGVQPTAVEDVLLRARTTFRVEEGQAVAKDKDGKIIYSKDGTTPLGIGDWIGGLKDTAAHLFQPSRGSGAGGGNGAVRDANAPATPQGKIAAGLAAGSSIMS